MPLMVLDRLPLPNIKTYLIVSVFFHVVSLYFALKATRDPDWRDTFAKTEKHNDSEYTIDIGLFIKWDALILQDRVRDVIEFMFRDFLCLWISINTMYCGLVLMGRALQQFVFGKLRPTEIINMREKFWNFVLYKFIFIFGVIKAQYVDEVLTWIAWFSVIGFLQIFVRLAKDRFDYIITVSMDPSIWKHFKVMGLLIGIFFISLAMVLIAAKVAVNSGVNIFAFMIAECFMLQIRVMHVIVKYFVDSANRFVSTNQLYVDPAQRLPSRRANIRSSMSAFFTRRLEMSGMYYLLLSLDLMDLCIEMIHHVHMLFWGNIFLSMASLAICMHLRVLISEINRKVRKHRTYLWVLKHMEKTYPIATASELQENSDNCAICWEKMETARKLPCGHLFHMGCLQLWLEQDTTCPTCRFALNVTGRNGNRRLRRTRQHFFHFDGSRYISWLPSFSVEVMHSSIRRHSTQNRNQLESMGRQIHHIFPHYPMSVIMENLRLTTSIDMTIENILDGRVTIPPYVESETLPVLEEQTQSEQIVELHSSVPASSSDRSNINVSEHSNRIPNERSNEEVVTQPTVSTLPINTNSNEKNVCVSTEFYSASRDRERALRHRRQSLIIMAKDKYLSKLNVPSSSS